jgi:hypothetical protein
MNMRLENLKSYMSINLTQCRHSVTSQKNRILYRGVAQEGWWGRAGEVAAAPGSQVQGATKWVVKMDILNAKDCFLRSTIFKLARQLNGNTINCF